MDEILRRLGEIETEMRELHQVAGDEPFTEEQEARWTELETQRAEQVRLRDEERTRQEQERAREGERERRRNLVAGFAARGNTEAGDGNLDARGVQVMRRVDPWDGSELRALSRTEVRDRSMKVLESRESARHLRSDQLDKVERLLRTRTDDTDGGMIGRRLLASENEAYRSAFVKAMHYAQPGFTDEEARAVAEFRAMAGGTDNAGGYGVPVELAA
ncbi:hypothetical protein ABGB18_42730 [Nonomuraea sp. B12E4]|uniref:hypothetical protein n=1 Tax=Nonomuraea sp. B12E4 TaxID=3153564 RepID=UPI00325DBBD0